MSKYLDIVPTGEARQTAGKRFPDPPTSAIKTKASDHIDYSTEVIHFARRVEVTTETFHCPICGDEMARPEHGVPTAHDCGVTLQVFGNTLYIWRAA